MAFGMVNRLAEALWQAESMRAAGEPRRVPWAGESEDTHQKWEFMARAALKGIGEPTEEMVQAAEWAVGDAGLLDFDEDDFRLAFDAAIRAASATTWEEVQEAASAVVEDSGRG